METKGKQPEPKGQSCRISCLGSRRFKRSGETLRNRNSKKEKKEKEGFYSFYKAEKLRSGKYISGIRPF